VCQGGAATASTASSDELAAVLRLASAAGVEVPPLSMYGVGPPARAGLVLGYGAIPATRIDEGLRRLRRCFDDQRFEAASTDGKCSSIQARQAGSSRAATRGA
jgi:hypothetical protein